ncbi:hypothetical protein [Actinomadura sp. 3N508]|uniref:hypothetical protein n=1 Tax=Actinomadura sp. 3N508 TaxID=3375153 RepID=UPI00379E7287
MGEPEPLAAREKCPHRHAYPTHGAYLEGRRQWRAYRRDEHLNPAEAAARWAVIEEHYLGALSPP